ncbi:MAG: rRNA adenine dimethyltransferase family protein [Phycisphaerales bacterium]
MQSLAEIRLILESRGLSPRKQFGQNFLLDQNLIRKLVDAAGVGAGDVVLEVGPGTGTLTDELVARGCVVIAAEIDRGLCAHLRERYASLSDRFVLVEGDCLEGKRTLAPALGAAIQAAMERAGRHEFVLVSNLPYGAGTGVMTTLLAEWSGADGGAVCRGMYVTIQREVGDRMMAKPGSKEFGPVGILAQRVAEVERVAVLPGECFWPRPDVTSVMMAIRRRGGTEGLDARGLFDFAQMVLGKRRKQLGSVLGRGFAMPMGIDPTRRAEDLSLEEMESLWRAWEAGGGRSGEA